MNDEEKAYWARAMQTNAGMMEAADFHLGRLLDHLEQSGQLDNTIVVVTSDNGPEWATLGKTSAPAVRAFEQTWMAIEGWDTDYENLGQRGSIAAIGHEWASVSAAPFHLFKFNASEGGLRVPMVIAGPGIQNLGFVDSRAQVADLVPTLLAAANVPYDPTAFYGRSQMPVLNGQSERAYSESDSFAFEVSGTIALYKANWKLTKTPVPFGDGEWKLFDISTDPGESKDLSSAHPDIFQELLSEYQSYADDVGLYKMAPGESARKQLVRNALTKASLNYWYVFAGLIALVLVILYGLYRALRVFFVSRTA